MSMTGNLERVTVVSGTCSMLFGSYSEISRGLRSGLASSGEADGAKIPGFTAAPASKPMLYNQPRRSIMFFLLALRNPLDFLALLFGQCESDQRIRDDTAEISAAAHRNHDELLVGFPDRIGHRGRMSVRFQRGDPQFHTAPGIKCSKTIIRSAADKHQSAGDDGAAEIWRPGW